MEFTYLQAIARQKRKGAEKIAFPIWGASRILLVVSVVCQSTPIFLTYIYVFLAFEILLMVAVNLAHLVPLEVFLSDRINKKDFDAMFQKVREYSSYQKNPKFYILKKAVSFVSSLYAFLALGWVWQAVI